MQKLIKSFTALAFVPPEDAQEAFNALKEVAGDTGLLEGFVSYFKLTLENGS